MGISAIENNVASLADKVRGAELNTTVFNDLLSGVDQRLLIVLVVLSLG